MRRGEITGTIASRSSVDQFVKNGYGRMIAQIGGSQKDIPQLKTLVKSESGRDLLALIESQSEIARLTAASPGRACAAIEGASRRLSQVDGRQGAAGAR